MFEDVHPTLDGLVRKGFKIAIRSNSAQPYGAVIEKLLPQYEVIKILSYEVGAIKPEPEIYTKIVNKGGVAPHEILFVGDTLMGDLDMDLERCIYSEREGHAQKLFGLLVKLFTNFSFSKHHVSPPLLLHI